MADYKMDKSLQEALETGHITRMAIDFDLKKITVWYKDRTLCHELDRMCDLYDAINEGQRLVKADYAFDARLMLTLQGLFVTENQSAGETNKASFRFDLYKDFKMENMRD